MKWAYKSSLPLAVTFIALGLLAQPCRATNVSGNISSNTVWTKAASPYVVTGDVNVQAGAILTIEAGATVEFTSGRALNVYGALLAIGASEEVILFTSATPTTEPGFWNRIYLYSSSSSKFKYCKVEYSASGIYLSYSSVKIENCILRRNSKAIALNYSNNVSVEGSAISSNETGIYFSAYSSGARIGNCLIEKNVRGVHSENYSSLTITDGRVASNEVGIALYSNSSAEIVHNDIAFNRTGVSMESAFANISYNSINSSESYGIVLGNVADLSIDHNLMLNNNDTAIFSDSFTNLKVRIRHNDISSNDKVGLNFNWGGTVSLKMQNNTFKRSRVIVSYVGYTAADSIIERNLFIGNKGTGATGVWLRANAPTFRLNTVVNWDLGLSAWSNPAGAVSFNDFSGNTVGVKKDWRGDYYDCRFNYWGASDGPAPGGGGSAVSGMVLYEPWLTQPVSMLSAETISTVRLFSDAAFAVPTGEAGILDRVFISVEAGTVSPEAINWLMVIVTSESDQAGLNIVLTETSSNSGVYTGSFRIDGNSTLSRAAYNLIKAAAGNTVRVFPLIDPSKAASISVSKIARWRAGNSPERIPSIQLNTGSTLEIEPGVTVEFFGGSITGNGMIIASGEPNSRIRFTSGNPILAAGDWSTVNVSGNGSKGSKFNYCDFEYAGSSAGYGSLHFYVTAASVDNCRFFNNSIYGVYTRASVVDIKNCLFEKNRTGLYAYLNPNLILADSMFENNGVLGKDAAVYLLSSNALIKGNTFKLNVPQAIFSETSAPVVKLNNFLGNSDYAIFNQSPTYPFNAVFNWWGSAEGPDVVDSRVVPNEGLGPQAGDKISAFIYYEPFLAQGPVSNSPPTGVSSVSIEGGSGILSRLFLELKGPDSSAESVNWASVKVTSESDPNGIVYDLVETGKDTGTFEGEVRVVASPNVSSEVFGHVRAAVGNTIRVYSVQSPEAYDVDPILAVATFELVNSPEILNRGVNFTLPTGSALLVQPGVTVEFEDGSGLNVIGTILASGEGGARISFTSRRKYPSPGSWGTFEVSSSGSLLRNCDIFYGQTNLSVNNSRPTVKGNSMRFASSNGVYLNSGYPEVEGNDISDNTGYGIFANNSNPRIAFNVVRNNGRSGGPCGIGLSGGSIATIEGNIILSNESYGIYLSNSGPNILIRGNTIEAGPNSSVRYCIYGRIKDPLVRFNNLIGNDSDDYGVYMEPVAGGVTPAIDAQFNYWSNAKAGLYVVSAPYVPGAISYSPPSAVGSVSLFKDSARTAITSGFGILDRVFISSSGTDSDPGKYNWTTVVISNESAPLNPNVLVDILEASSGNFSGEARVGASSDDWVDMIGASVGNNLKVSSQVSPASNATLTVLSVATWEAANNPERILNYSNLTLPNNSTLRVKPGVTVEAGNNVQINISGTLEARGVKGNRIRFVPLNPVFQPGSWAGVKFTSTGKGLIAYSDIKHASTGVTIEGSSPMLAMVNMESCRASGLDIRSMASPKILDCEITGNTEGVRLGIYTGNARVSYNNLVHSEHSKYGINNTSTKVLTAESNWWNSPSGPGPVGAGEGLKVSAYVDYDPFLTSTNEPGGPIASNPRPGTLEATSDSYRQLRVKLFDPEDVVLPSITIEVNGTTVASGDSRLAYDPNSYDIIFTPSSSYEEGPNTFEVVWAVDTFDEPLRFALGSTFIVDISSPEITGARVFPYYARAGSALITVEAFDAVSGLKYPAGPISPRVQVKLKDGKLITAKLVTYESGAWTGILAVLGTFENGLATVEADRFSDNALNLNIPSLEAAHFFIDTASPSITTTSPPGGITLEGPSTYVISWEGVTDPSPSSGFSAAPISIYLLTDNISYLITSEIANAGSYVWDVPPFYSHNCRIAVVVRDNAGNAGADTSEVFAIETLNPFVLSVSPYNGETNVPTTEPVTIVFSKAMSTESVQDAISIYPVLSGSFEWTAGDTVVIYRPQPPLGFSSTYEVTLSAGPVDKFGHVMLDAPYVFLFTTVYPESGKPTISAVKLDDRSYRENDVVSSRPKITATVLDNVGGVGVAQSGISFHLGFYQVQPDSYDSLTGEAKVRITEYPLGRGYYLVTIEAVDRAGNAADPWTGRVRVMGGAVQVIGPTLAYPTPFRPMSGERATIAYTLSTDADITVYMYDASGKVVLTKKFGSGVAGGKAGYNGFEWNGVSDFGGVIGNGIYVYKITSGSKSLATGKIVVYD